MKKASIILCMALAAYACSHKTVAPATSTTGSTATTTTTTPTPPATPAAPAAPEATLATKVAEGQVVYTNRCGRCHALKPVPAYTVAEWDNILKSMIPKAKLDATQADQVTAYVKANAKRES